MNHEPIYQEITAERTRQDALHGGARHDDRHTCTDWVALLVRHLGLAIDDGKPGAGTFHGPSNSHSLCENPARYRRQLVRVAAVAVAALEAFDRKVGNYTPPPDGTVKPDIILESPRPIIKPDTIDWWQKVADQLGETLLVLTRRDPASYAEGPVLPHAVPEAGASPWQKANHDSRIEPRK